MKGSTAAHNKLLDDVLLAVGSKKDVRLWVRVVGYDEVKRITYGIKGEPDLEGIIYPSGRMLCIECKSGGAVLSKDQKKRRLMLEAFGALYIVARSVDQVLAELKNAGVV